MDSFDSRRSKAMADALKLCQERMTEDEYAAAVEDAIRNTFATTMGKIEQDASYARSMTQSKQEKYSEFAKILSAPLASKQPEKDLARVSQLLIDDVDLDLILQGMLPYGQTFLSAAASYGYDMLKLLLEHGADPNLENDMGGDTALDEVELWVEDMGDDESEAKAELIKMKNILLAKGAKLVQDRMMGF